MVMPEMKEVVPLVIDIKDVVTLVSGDRYWGCGDSGDDY